MGRQLSVHFVANSRLVQYLLCQHDIGGKEVAPPPAPAAWLRNEASVAK